MNLNVNYRTNAGAVVFSAPVTPEALPYLIHLHAPVIIHTTLGPVGAVTIVDHIGDELVAKSQETGELVFLAHVELLSIDVFPAAAAA